MSERTEQVMAVVTAMIQRGAAPTLEDVAAATGYSVANVHAHVRRLCDDGRLTAGMGPRSLSLGGALAQRAREREERAYRTGRKQVQMWMADYLILKRLAAGLPLSRILHRLVRQETARRRRAARRAQQAQEATE